MKPARQALRGARRVALSCALLLVVLAATACEITPTARIPTPTPTPTISPTPAQPGITRLNLPITGAALPSPDGTMLAGADVRSRTVTLYTLGGAVLAQFTTPQNAVLNYNWLPDSSGLFVWPLDLSSLAPGPLSILSPQGSVQSTGVSAFDAALSPDGAWIAATHFSSDSSPSSIEVVPRRGGAVRVLASGMGIGLLGWQGGNVIYAANGNLYAIALSGGAAHLLVSEGGVAWELTVGVGSIMSPDGQVLILFARHQGFARLVGAQVLPLPPQIMSPIIWTGPHQALGYIGEGDADVESDVVIVDMVSGTVVQDTGAKAPAPVQALSGEWVGAWAQAAFGQPVTLHFTNLTTKREVDLGPAPNGGGGFYSLGQGRFFLHGNGESYLLDPAAALPL